MPYPPILNVYESQPVQTFSGILTPGGQPIMKTIMPEPMGFVHFPEPDDEMERHVNVQN